MKFTITDATVATVYKITRPDGTLAILKICPTPHQYARELYFLNFFADTLPVPRILDVVQPEEGIDGAILMEYLPGSLLIAQEFTGKLAYSIGQLLARIHSNRTTDSDPRILFIQKFNESLDECKNHLPKTLIAQCRVYFDSHLDLLNPVDRPCIVHRDFRLGNIIMHDNKISGIIDWSSAREGLVQEDFCFLYRENPPLNPDGKNSFLAGYASIRTIPDYQTMMPLLLLHKAVTTIGFTVQRGTWNTSNSFQDLRISSINRLI